MSLNEKKSSIQLTGKITTGIFSKGSKSEHAAVYLETEQGSFVLRRTGANPFDDPDLKKLNGKTVTAKGRILNNIFFASEVEEIPSSPGK
jgi:hypothetical protein